MCVHNRGYRLFMCCEYFLLVCACNMCWVWEDINLLARRAYSRICANKHTLCACKHTRTHIAQSNYSFLGRTMLGPQNCGDVARCWVSRDVHILHDMRDRATHVVGSCTYIIVFFFLLIGRFLWCNKQGQFIYLIRRSRDVCEKLNQN